MARSARAAPTPRISLIGAFVVVVLGLASVEAVVLLAVEPQLERLREIANDHARAVQTTTRIRSRISAARRALLTELASAPAARAAGEEFARLREEARSVLSLAETPAQRADVQALDAALDRCAQESFSIEQLIARSETAIAGNRVEAFVELTRLANEAADEIVTFNADRVEALSRRVRGSLRWTVLAAGGLTFAGAASALLLLRRALRGLDAERTAAETRAVELEAFAARAAHELRSPLQSLSLALRVLEAGSNPTTLLRARRSADRLRDTVDDLLEFARAGVSRRDRGSSALTKVLSDVEGELAEDLTSASMALDVHVPLASAVAMAPTHLATIFRNVIGNAVKYGGGRDGASVTVRATDANGRIRVEVADNGPGIPSDALSRVFEPFVRATTRRPGSGLGLATVRRLVEAHDGAVRISSEPGRGTTVEIELPKPLAARAEPHAAGSRM